MKKLIPLLMALLLLSACGAPAAPEPANTPAAPEKTQETQTPEETQAPEEDETMKEETTEAPVVMTDSFVTLDGLDSYLRLWLAEGWTWTEGEQREGMKSLVLHAPTDDGFSVQLCWWDSFGMCGTGVDFRELELPGGMKATLATETSREGVWWTLILPPSPDQFTVQFGAPQALIDAHQAELDAMLATLQIGVLAHQTTVKPPVADR